MAEAEARPDPAAAMGGGAAVGGLLGALPGIGGARGRMAGGLIGAITGGALGLGASAAYKGLKKQKLQKNDPRYKALKKKGYV